MSAKPKSDDFGFNGDTFVMNSQGQHFSINLQNAEVLTERKQVDETGNKKIVIYDLLGHKISEKAGMQNDDFLTDFHLPAGIYIIQEMVGNTQVATKKLIVQ